MTQSLEPLRRAYIAGTGRAGTTFLVQFLSACGLDCGDLDQQLYFESAAAGLEHHPLDPHAPYVVKNPSLHEFVDRIDLNEVMVEALVIPVRDLRVAAQSRVLRERAEMKASMAEASEATTFGRTPGGILYSLSVDDQERILAVGQARLISWAVANGLPLYLLDFPRLVDDADYVVDALWPWLQHFTDRESALDAHERVVEPDKMRVGRGFGPSDLEDSDRELERLQIELAATNQALERLRLQQEDPDKSLRFEVGVLMRLKSISEAVGVLSDEVRELAARIDRTE